MKKPTHYAVVRVDEEAPGKVLVACSEARLARHFVKSFNSFRNCGPALAGLRPVKIIFADSGEPVVE
jgi:hypothetical protein